MSKEEETKQVMEKAADDVAMLSLEDRGPWARLRKEVEGIESKHHSLSIRSDFEAQKRVVLEVLADLESRKCPHLPRVINERDLFLYPQWDNLDTRTSMGAHLWDRECGVYVASRGEQIASYDWPGKNNAAEVIMRYLHLVFPVDPPGWDRLRAHAKIHSAHATCPKSVRDYFEKTKQAVVDMLCALQARGCSHLPEIASGYYDGIGLQWRNGKRRRVVYGLRNGLHQVDGVTDSHATNDRGKAVDLVLEHLKILFASDKKE